MTGTESQPGRRTPYVETFDDGPGGWMAWLRPRTNVLPEIRDGALVSRSPWGVDPNHAPPGAGYLSMLWFLHTRGDRSLEIEKPNRFVDGGFGRDLTNARLTARLRGEVDLKGTQMILLVQGETAHTNPPFVLTGQPFEITREWSDQTVTLSPDPAQWLGIGGRHDLPNYGYGEIADVLRDVNFDFMFILFPLNIVPTTAVEDIHRLLPHRDYEADQRYLPRGEIWMDTVRVDYPD